MDAKSIRSLPSQFPSAAWPIVSSLFICVAAVFPRITLFAAGLGFLLWGIFFLRCLVTLIVQGYFTTRYAQDGMHVSIDRRFLLFSVVGIITTFLMIYVPVWSIIFFWRHRAELEELAQRVPYSMAIYDSYGDSRVGKYPVQGIGRYPHWLEIDLIATPLPSDPKPTFTPHQIEFILEDEKNYQYDNSNRFRVGGKWYVPTYSVFRRAVDDYIQWQKMTTNKS